MKFTARLLVCCASLALVETPAMHGDEPILLQRVGPATLRMTGATKEPIVLAFTDLLDLTIEVTGGEDLDVRAPEIWTKSPWQARPSAAAEYKKSNDKTVWTQALRVEPLQPGELTLTLEPLRYRSDGGDWQTVTWKPIAVRVTSQLTQPDIKNARDITAIEELPPRLPPKRQIELIVIIAVGAFLAALTVGIFVGRHRRKARNQPTPEAWALDKLQRLQALQLAEQGKHERFGTLLTGLLRRYLEKRFDLPVRRQTTGEFLATLADRADLASQREFLEPFFRRCDQLKFAPITTTVDECRALAEQVSQFISSVGDMTRSRSSEASAKPQAAQEKL